MKAVTCTHPQLEVVDQPNPTPAKGQLLVDVLRCGICGSDLHARRHCDELADIMAESGYHAFMRSDQHVVFGHEFCGEVVDYGPGTRKTPRPGTRVVAMPLLRRGKGVHGIGLSTMAPGAYAEQHLVEQSMTFPVPNGLAPACGADIVIDPAQDSPYSTDASHKHLRGHSRGVRPRGRHAGKAPAV